MMRPQPRSTLFPYTTLFRSVGSPSDTTEITIDILETAEASRIRGQMVYMVLPHDNCRIAVLGQISRVETQNRWHEDMALDRKSTRLNSSHSQISYAVFCLKK